MGNELVGRRKVLIVEDDAPLRKALREMLTHLGYHAVEAGSGTSARNELAAHAPDLVCLDIGLPESSGYDICEYIRSSPEHKRVRVLMMSERTLPGDRAQAYDSGADDYLAKPFSSEQLLARIEALLQKMPPGETEEDECKPAS